MSERAKPTDVATTDFYDRAHRLANEIAQHFMDIEHWNRTNPDEEPIDPDPDGELRAMHAHCVKILRSEIRRSTPDENTL